MACAAVLPYAGLTARQEGILVIGSRSPLRDLEEVIASVPRAAPGRPVRYGRVDAARWSRLRSIGGIVKEKPVSGEEPRLIEAALRSLDERRKERGDVWLWRTTLTSVTHTSDANTAR